MVSDKRTIPISSSVRFRITMSVFGASCSVFAEVVIFYENIHSYSLCEWLQLSKIGNQTNPTAPQKLVLIVILFLMLMCVVSFSPLISNLHAACVDSNYFPPGKFRCGIATRKRVAPRLVRCFHWLVTSISWIMILIKSVTWVNVKSLIFDFTAFIDTWAKDFKIPQNSMVLYI